MLCYVGSYLVCSVEGVKLPFALRGRIVRFPCTHVKKTIETGGAATGPGTATRTAMLAFFFKAAWRASQYAHKHHTWAERARARMEQDISQGCCKHCMDVAFAPLSFIPEGEFCGETQNCVDLIRNKSKRGHDKSPARRALG